jgi:hypothetical protein
MPNVKVQMKSKAHMTKFMLKENLTLRPFGIHLAFACLRQAGILKFATILRREDV